MINRACGFFKRKKEKSTVADSFVELPRSSTFVDYPASVTKSPTIVETTDTTTVVNNANNLETATKHSLENTPVKKKSTIFQEKQRQKNTPEEEVRAPQKKSPEEEQVTNLNKSRPNTPQFSSSSTVKSLSPAGRNSILEEVGSLEAETSSAASRGANRVKNSNTVNATGVRESSTMDALVAKGKEWLKLSMSDVLRLQYISAFAISIGMTLAPARFCQHASLGTYNATSGVGQVMQFMAEAFFAQACALVAVRQSTDVHFQRRVIQSCALFRGLSLFTLATVLKPHVRSSAFTTCALWHLVILIYSVLTTMVWEKASGTEPELKPTKNHRSVALGVETGVRIALGSGAFFGAWGAATPVVGNVPLFTALLKALWPNTVGISGATGGYAEGLLAGLLMLSGTITMATASIGFQALHSHSADAKRVLSFMFVPLVASMLLVNRSFDDGTFDQAHKFTVRGLFEGHSGNLGSIFGAGFDLWNFFVSNVQHIWEAAWHLVVEVGVVTVWNTVTSLLPPAASAGLNQAVASVGTFGGGWTGNFANLFLSLTKFQIVNMLFMARGFFLVFALRGHGKKGSSFENERKTVIRGWLFRISTLGNLLAAAHMLFMPKAGEALWGSFGASKSSGFLALQVGIASWLVSDLDAPNGTANAVAQTRFLGMTLFHSAAIVFFGWPGGFMTNFAGLTSFTTLDDVFNLVQYWSVVKALFASFVGGFFGISSLLLLWRIHCCLAVVTFSHLFDKQARHCVVFAWDFVIYAIENWVPGGLGKETLAIVFSSVDAVFEKAVDPVCSPAYNLCRNAVTEVWARTTLALHKVPFGFGDDAVRAVKNVIWLIDVEDPFKRGFKTNFSKPRPAPPAARAPPPGVAATDTQLTPRLPLK